MTRAFSKIWIIGILAVVLVGGFFAWQKGLLKISQKMNVPEKTTDETADWKVYRNKESMFDVGYPKDWSVSEETPYTLFASADYAGETISSPINQIVNSGTRVIINRYENSGNFTLNQLVADYTIPQNKRSIEIGGAQGVVMDTIVEFAVHETVVMLSKGKFVYSIVRTYPELQRGQYEDVFNQMLSTFRFLE